jgi:predicted nucleic-acid-binding Zn-ribbon protein
MGFDTSGGRLTLSCPLCENTTFQREESRQDSRWGFTSHRMTLMVCRRCRYVLHFYDEHSIFDFD